MNTVISPMKNIFSRPRRWIAAAVVAVMGVTGCNTFDAWQRKTIFSVATDGRWHQEPTRGTEEFDIALANGDKVHAWYWKSPDPKAATVLYLHGARWNLNGSAFRFDNWTEMGFSVLAIDYRGFGKSTNRLPSENTAYEDGLAALKELAKRQPDPSKRFVYGHSLGGAVAVHLAAYNVKAEPFAGLIVESSFTSIADMVRTLRWGWIPGLPALVTQQFDSRGKLSKVDTPLLLIHGTADGFVPLRMSEELLKAATAVPDGYRRLVKIEGGNHSGRRGLADKDYRDPIRAFVRDAGARFSTATAATTSG